MKTPMRKQNRWGQRRRQAQAKPRLDLEAWYRSEQDEDGYRALSVED